MVILVFLNLNKFGVIYISKLWKFLNGYVIISIKGYNIEKLINKANQNNLKIYSVKKDKNLATLTISPKDFKGFKKLSRKYKCKIKIINKNGFFRVLLFFRNNIFYIVGIFVALLFIFFMSQRIWIIDISGNSNISNKNILKFCSENSLYLGCNKNKIDGKKLSENLKIKYNTISWINISVKGSTAIIKLSEDKPINKIEKMDKPCDVVASSNCKILSIVTNKGTPMVKKGDTVLAGDVLISSMLVPSGQEENPVNDFVSAKGDIKGLVQRNYSFTIPFNISEKAYTNNIKKEYSIKIFSKEFQLNKIKLYDKFDKNENIVQLKLGESCPLPFFIKTQIYREYILENKKIDVETAKKKAEKQILDYIILNYDTKTDIISVNKKYNKTDISLEVSTEIISEENVGIEKVVENTGGYNINGENTNSSSS